MGVARWVLRPHDTLPCVLILDMNLLLKKKKSLIKDKREDEMQRSHIHWNPKGTSHTDEFTALV